MLNPCCFISPRIGTLIFAILDLILGILYLVPWILGIFERQPHTDTWIAIGNGIFLVVFAVVLLIGALKNSAENIRIWLYGWLIFLIVVVVLSVLFRVHIYSRWESSVALFILFMYEVWVVLAFYKELRYGPASLIYCPAKV